MEDCIFCRILAGEIPGDFVHRGDLVSAFRDINPVAPTHILIVPNKHIPSNDAVTDEDEEALGRLFLVARDLAKEEGIAESGYRLILNTGPHGGQEVYHLHLHLIGGQRMKHPMG
ncbi:MAG TPA: histidine triad nucleotide-binding protein [Anaerolineales bacterium]|nr:histidine triad nucleotide-binding protein [Anaerolineales bacterium]